MKQTKYQISESVFVICMLALTGGFLETYSFLCRDQVFANCQTGNLVLMAMYLSQGNLYRAFIYMIPIFAFILGILLTNRIRDKLPQQIFHWRQLTLFIEILVMILVGWIPYGPWNIAATTLISFACSIQVETFRKVKGTTCATTMCTGNLRSAVDFLYQFFTTKEQRSLQQAFHVLMIIGSFLLGAVLGSITTNRWQVRAIWFTLFVLLPTFLIMFPNFQPEKHKEKLS